MHCASYILSKQLSRIIISNIKISAFHLFLNITQEISTKQTVLPTGNTQMFVSGSGNQHNWRRSIVVRTLVSTGELSLSCARLLAGRVVICLLSVSQHGQLSHPPLRGR